MQKASCRLPDTVVPLKYSLCYDDLDLDRCTFNGQVAIDCQVNEELFYLLIFCMLASARVVAPCLQRALAGSYSSLARRRVSRVCLNQRCIALCSVRDIGAEILPVSTIILQTAHMHDMICTQKRRSGRYRMFFVLRAA